MLTDILLLFAVGFVAGIINTLAGGGSLLTLPVLIFLGLPSNVANATNRIGIFFNSLFAVQGFKSKGLKIHKYSLWLGVSAFLGAILGSFIAVDTSGETFNRILAGVMVVIVAYMLFGSKAKDHRAERTDKRSQALGIIAFFFAGIYGGFIQAGVGYVIMSSLSFINRFSLLKTNVTKVVVVLIYTLASLAVFIYKGLINWELGMALAAGTATGGYFTSRWVVNKADRWVRYFVMLTALAFAAKLMFGP